MDTTYNVRVTKLDEDVEFDLTKLPEASVRYVTQYGFNKSINDAHASIKSTDYQIETEWLVAVRDAAFKRIEQIRSGDVPGTRAPASPVAKLGRQVAAAAVEAGVDVSKIDPAKLLAALKKLAA